MPRTPRTTTELHVGAETQTKVWTTRVPNNILAEDDTILQAEDGSGLETE